MTVSDAMTAPEIWWGTNRSEGLYYAGRVHVVWSDCPRHALCGLPIDDAWANRPPTPERLCPECCLLAIAWLLP
jgi:hypothetical protein